MITSSERFILIMIVIGMVIGLIAGILVSECLAEPIQLPISGIHPKLDLDEYGNAYLIYFPGPNNRQIRYYNLQTGQDEQVPGSTNRFLWSWDIMYAGIGAGYGLVAIAWCYNNTDIWYVERDLVNNVWIEYDSIYHGSGVNRTDIDIGPDGIMLLVQKAGQTFSMYKPHGGSFIEIPLFYQTGDPRVEYIINSFYGTINTGTVQKFAKFSNGSWNIISFFNLAGIQPEIDGYPDAAGFFVDQNENIYASSLLWLNSTHDYRHVYVGHFENGNQKIEIIYSGYLAPDDSRPPANSLAVDSSGNIVACFGNSIESKSYCRIKKKGQGWQNLEQKGDSNFIVVDYFYPYFHIVYNCGGNFWHEQFTFETVVPTPTLTATLFPTPTPTRRPTRTPISTATATMTKIVTTPTWTPTAQFTPVPTDTPGQCPTPQCSYQIGNQGICCTWQSLVMIGMCLCGVGVWRRRC